MAGNSEADLFRFVAQRRAAKAGSTFIPQAHMLKVATAQNELKNDIQTLGLADHDRDRQSRLEFVNRYEEAGKSLDVQGDAFDTDVEDVDDTSTISPPTVKSTRRRKGEQEGRIRSAKITDDHGIIDIIKEPKGEAIKKEPISKFIQSKHQGSLHFNSRLHSQTGALRSLPQWQNPDGLELQPQDPTQNAAPPHRAPSISGKIPVDVSLQKVELKDTASRRKRTDTPQVASPTPRKQRATHRPEHGMLGDFVGNGLAQRDVSSKVPPVVDNDSDFDSQSSQEEFEGPHKRSDEAQMSKRKRGLDYGQSELARMTYQDLKEESFDVDPNADDHSLPAKLVNGTVSEKLHYAFSCRKNDQKATHRELFFQSLTIQEHEQCGDLILEQFGDILSRFKELRRQKRALCRDYELEIEQRYELIEAKKVAIEKDLDTMRAKGNDIVPRKSHGEFDKGPPS